MRTTVMSIKVSLGLLKPAHSGHSGRSRNFLFAILLAGLLLAGCSSERVSQDSQSSASGSQSAPDTRTALDDYIVRPDTNYSYHLVTNFTGKGQTTFILEMTSQAWLTTNEVDRPL